MKRKKKKPDKNSARLREQRKFVFNEQIDFEKVGAEDIYDASHIFEQIKDIIDLLKNFRRYRGLNVELDAGAVLHGAAGLGKTLFSRYIASKNSQRSPLGLTK